MGVGHIPFETMVLYKDTFGLIGTFEEFVYVIGKMDSAYISHVEEKAKLAKKANQNGK